MSRIDQPLVMLVDDNDMDLFINKKMLHVGGISDNIISFPSANDALFYLSLNSDNPAKLPSIMLLDILMPGINGFQFLDLFNNYSEDVKSRIKIIMVSSTVDPVDRSRAEMNAHVIDILAKPLEPQMLKNVLTQCGIGTSS